MRVPPYLRLGEIAEACEISIFKARSLAKRAGIIEKVGKTYVVGESRLRERLPEMYDRVFEHFDSRAK